MTKRPTWTEKEFCLPLELIKDFDARAREVFHNFSRQEWGPGSSVCLYILLKIFGPSEP